MKGPKVTLARLSRIYGEHLPQLVEDEKEIKSFLDDLAAKKVVIPIGDKDVPEQLSELVKKWRTLSSQHDWNGPVAYRVKAGFHFKSAQNIGLCHNGWKNPKRWKIKEGDEPTTTSTVFWIPRLLEGSTRKNLAEQKRLLVETRTRLGLPEHHVTFGSVSLLTALILCHLKRTGERVPLRFCTVRTDTIHANGDRLYLGLEKDALNCIRWPWDSIDGGELLGCFAVGVEPEN